MKMRSQTEGRRNPHPLMRSCMEQCRSCWKTLTYRVWPPTLSPSRYMYVPIGTQGACNESVHVHVCTVLLTSPPGRGEVLVLIVCVCVSVRPSVTVLAGATGTWRAKLRYQQKALDVTNKTKAGILLKMFSLRVMTDFSSPQILYFVLMPQNPHQRDTSTVTRLLVRQARRLAIPTTANQAAQTELAS